MKTDLEKYLNKKRQALDVEEPDVDMLWEGISHSMQHKNTRLFPVILKAAAAMIVLIGAAYLLANLTGIGPFKSHSLAEVDDLLGEREFNYREIVEQKTALINRREAKQIEITDFLLEELEFLDRIYSEAMTDLNETGYSEQIVNIIFDTYEKKIEILEQIIVELQKSKIEQQHEDKVLL